MEAILKFKEAAKGLQEEEVYLNYQKAREDYDNDTELQNLVGEFNLAKLNLDQEMERPASERNQEKLTDLNASINMLYASVMGNARKGALDEARAGLEDFVEYVNAVLNAAIDGKNPMDVEPPEDDACGPDGCAGCSGCH